jgi:sugar lactone lactonase YvrE
MTPRLLVAAHHPLAEGPHWFEDRWWWVDVDLGSVHSCDALGQQPWSHSFGERIGAFAPLDKDHFVIAFERRLSSWNRKSGQLETLAELHDEPPENRFNDGKLDPSGRFVVGTLNKDGRRGTAGLYSLDCDNRMVRLLSGIHLSNGLAWSADGETLFHVDTLAYEIAAYTCNRITGELSDRRIAVRVSPEMGLPDGMTIDAEGNLWVAHWGGHAVRCWCPGTGRCLTQIRVPCSQPTACQFGGPDGKDLIITTARADIPVDKLGREPLAGSIFTVRIT